MAKKHPEAKSTRRKGTGKTVAAKTLAELDTAALTRRAEEKAQEDRRNHPIKYLSDEDILAVDRSLYEVAYGVLAIHRLSIEGGEDKEGFYLMAIKHLARSNFKTLDACMNRLQGTKYGIGNFATEFDFN